MPRFAAAFLLVLVCWPIGCIDDSSTIPTTIVPNLVTADPTSFLGQARCGSDVLSYVVTLYDVTSGTRARVGTSTPTECTRQTSFGAAVIAYRHAYVADIDGYDRDDLVPDTSANAGPGDLVDPVTLQRVLRRWTTTCGERPVPPDAEPADGSDSPEGAPSVDDASTVDAGSTGADASIDFYRFPTVVLSSGEVVLHPCLPFRAVIAPAPEPDGGSLPDRADTTDDGTEAASEERIEGATDAGVGDASGLEQ